ncbi:KAP family NTPase [Burkholderiaceae bacterium]|nr:KAP family NTPase [Burkholderiaceae bacterium]
MPEIAVSPNEKFDEDKLDRREIVETLHLFIDATPAPYVLALDGVWGSGKTTLVKILKADLEDSGYQCVYFDAWRVDYMVDPLIALVGALAELVERAHNEHRADALAALKKSAAIIAVETVGAVAQIVTKGLVSTAAIQACTEARQAQVFSDYEAAKKTTEQFAKKLEAAAKSILEHPEQKPKHPEQKLEHSEQKKIIFFVDELDRCRPTFAVHLLERIKHLFDIQNIFFVLSVDKAQLEASMRGVYGTDTDAPEYLRRFIDFDYRVPCVPTKSFTTSLFEKFGLIEKLKGRQGDFRADAERFITYFTIFATAYRLSARAQGQCVGRLAVVVQSATDRHYLHPPIVVLLIILRVKQPALYQRWIAGDLPAAEFIQQWEGTDAVIESYEKSFIHAYLLAVDPKQGRAKQDLDVLKDKADDENTSQDEKYMLSSTLSTHQQLSRIYNRPDQFLSHWDKKIQLYEDFGA